MVNYSCPYDDCSSTFSRPYRLRLHIKRHQGIKDFHCNQCDRSYHRQQHLQRHIAEVHQNQARPKQLLSCDHCDRKFNTAWGLRRHQVKIKEQKTRIRQHVCETCGRKFFSHDDLKRHSLLHERFKCNVPSCPMLAHQFSWANYRKHMSNYHSEPFTCEHCGEQFLIKSQIRKHVAQHMPEFLCTQPGCDRTFTSDKIMRYHIRVGHEERIYKCNVPECDWKFKYKMCLNNHLKVHQKNGKIAPMANRINKKESFMAKKLAILSLKI